MPDFTPKLVIKRKSVRKFVRDFHNTLIINVNCGVGGLVPNAPNAVISAGWRFDIYVCSEFATKLFCL